MPWSKPCTLGLEPNCAIHALRPLCTTDKEEAGTCRLAHEAVDYEFNCRPLGPDGNEQSISSLPFKHFSPELGIRRVK